MNRKNIGIVMLLVIMAINNPVFAEEVLNETIYNDIFDVQSCNSKYVSVCDDNIFVENTVIADSDEEEAMLSQKAIEIMKKSSVSWDDLTMAHYLHDWLVDNVEYDWEGYRGKAPVKSSAYNAVVEGTAVCNGYASAYKYLMEMAGIECEYVSSPIVNHAWNIVKLNGIYYYVDTTWDDPVSYEDMYGSDVNNDIMSESEIDYRHRYFLVSRDNLHETHVSEDWKNDEGINVYQTYKTGNDYDNYTWECLDWNSLSDNNTPRNYKVLYKNKVSKEYVGDVQVKWNCILGFQGRKVKAEDFKTLSVSCNGKEYKVKKIKMKSLSKNGIEYKMYIRQLTGDSDRKEIKRILKEIKKHPFGVYMSPYTVSAANVEKCSIRGGRIRKLKLNLPKKKNFNARKFASVLTR